MKTDPQISVQGDYVKVEADGILIKVAQGGHSVINKIAHADHVHADMDEGEKRVSPAEAFTAVIKDMVETSIICKPQDFCAIYKLDTEMAVIGFSNVPDFLKRIKNIYLKDIITDNVQPDANHFKRMNLGSIDFPDWPWSEISDAVHIKAVANAYIRGMASYSYKHKSLG